MVDLAADVGAITQMTENSWAVRNMPRVRTIQLAARITTVRLFFCDRKRLA